MNAVGHTLNDALLACVRMLNDGDQRSAPAQEAPTRRAPFDELPELEDLWPMADALIAPR